jgi:hypothetical protein
MRTPRMRPSCAARRRVRSGIERSAASRRNESMVWPIVYACMADNSSWYGRSGYRGPKAIDNNHQAGAAPTAPLSRDAVHDIAHSAPWGRGSARNQVGSPSANGNTVMRRPGRGSAASASIALTCSSPPQKETKEIVGISCGGGGGVRVCASGARAAWPVCRARRFIQRGRGDVKVLGPRALYPVRFPAGVRRSGAQYRRGFSERWRDPDSNRGHHDFQGRANLAGKSTKVLQIGWSQIARAPRRYP